MDNWIRLSHVEGIGETRLRNLITHFGSPDKVFDESLENLGRFIDIKTAEAIKTAQNSNIEKELSLINSLNVKVLKFNEDLYPESLKEIEVPPPILYVRGEIKEQDKRAIAIIGTRRPTFYGKFVAEDFAQGLAQKGITIVSGMARGIDTSAHKGALKAKGRTIAVLGCGIDRIYPPENKELMQRIISNGACISEFPMGTGPLAENFPKRNRIISGLCLGVIIVEAGMRSGTFITVNAALDQGKEVFAVPGNITSEQSKGTNKLIMDGAKPVTSVDDVLNFLGIHIDYEKKLETIQLSLTESKILSLLSSEPEHIDSISGRSKIPVSQLSALFLGLELKDIIKQLPGRYFVKNV